MRTSHVCRSLELSNDRFPNNLRVQSTLRTHFYCKTDTKKKVVTQVWSRRFIAQAITLRDVVIFWQNTQKFPKQSRKESDSHNYWAHNGTSYNAINVSIYYLFNILIKCRERTAPVGFINITYEYWNLNWIGFSAIVNTNQAHDSNKPDQDSLGTIFHVGPLKSSRIKIGLIHHFPTFHADLIFFFRFCVAYRLNWK